jgi:hypothetical protein
MNKYITNVLILIAAISGLFLLFKLVNYVGIVGENVQSEKPMVICSNQNASPDQQKCHWTAHIHAQVKIFHKGKEVSIGYEQGDLQKGHTHAKKNKLHWHGLLPVDPTTKQIIDSSEFRIEKIPNDLNIQLSGKRRFVVNGKEKDGSYEWKDGDIVEIYYE